MFDCTVVSVNKFDNYICYVSFQFTRRVEGMEAAWRRGNFHKGNFNLNLLKINFKI
jgi:hypothetical protein